MADFCLRNNTLLPFHAAVGWDNIIQDFHNNIAPGEVVHLKIDGFGYSDFMFKVAGDANGYSHDEDWLAALGLGVTIVGIALSLATAGGSDAVAAPIVATIEGGIGALATASGVSGGIALAGIVGDIAGVVLKPAALTGIPRGRVYDATIGGAKITGKVIPATPPATEPTFKIESTAAATLNWTEKGWDNRKGALSSGEKKAY